MTNTGTFDGVFYEPGTINGRESWRMGQTHGGHTTHGEWVQTTPEAIRAMAAEFAARVGSTLLGRKTHNAYLPE